MTETRNRVRREPLAHEESDQPVAPGWLAVLITLMLQVTYLWLIWHH